MPRHPDRHPDTPPLKHTLLLPCDQGCRHPFTLTAGEMVRLAARLTLHAQALRIRELYRAMGLPEPASLRVREEDPLPLTEAGLARLLRQEGSDWP